MGYFSSSDDYPLRIQINGGRHKKKDKSGTLTHTIFPEFRLNNQLRAHS